MADFGVNEKVIDSIKPDTYNLEEPNFNVAKLDGSAQLICAANAWSCQRPESGLQIKKQIEARGEEKGLKMVRGILKGAIGSGHAGIGDQGTFVINFEKIPRLITLQHARYPYGFSLLQQSSRARPLLGIHIPEVIKQNPTLYKKVQAVEKKVWRNYLTFIKNKMTMQDAMYVLPLYALTNNTVSGNARAWIHYYMSSMESRNTKLFEKKPYADGPIKKPKIVQDIAQASMNVLKENQKYLFRDYGPNYELIDCYPSGTDFLATKNPIMERTLRNPKLRPLNKMETEAVLLSYDNPHIITHQDVETALKKRDEGLMSAINTITYKLATFSPISTHHDSFRNRSVFRVVEPFIHAAMPRNFKYFTPPVYAQMGLKDLYDELIMDQMNLFWSMYEEGIPVWEAIGFVPHAMGVHDVITVTGWNVFHLLGLRLCSRARPTMQKWANDIANAMQTVDSPLNDFMTPRGVHYGGCREKNNCGRCAPIIKRLNQHQELEKWL
jgi:thymidylate synthase ThyX